MPPGDVNKLKAGLTEKMSFSSKRYVRPLAGEAGIPTLEKLLVPKGGLLGRKRSATLALLRRWHS